MRVLSIFRFRLLRGPDFVCSWCDESWVRNYSFMTIALITILTLLFNLICYLEVGSIICNIYCWKCLTSKAIFSKHGFAAGWVDTGRCKLWNILRTKHQSIFKRELLYWLNAWKSFAFHDNVQSSPEPTSHMNKNSRWNNIVVVQIENRLYWCITYIIQSILVHAYIFRTIIIILLSII